MCDFLKKMNTNAGPLLGAAAVAIAVIGPKTILQTLGLGCKGEEKEKKDVLSTPATCKTSLTFSVPSNLPADDAKLFEQMLDQYVTLPSVPSSLCCITYDIISLHPQKSKFHSTYLVGYPKRLWKKSVPLMKCLLKLSPGSTT